MTIKSGGIIHLAFGPRINRSRPAIDPLFRSAAKIYGNKTIGIILSGLFDDGILGLNIIKNVGGHTIVQDPKEAPYPDMPLNALQNVNIDYCLTIKDMVPIIASILNKHNPSTINKSDNKKFDQIEAAIDEKKFTM